MRQLAEVPQDLRRLADRRTPRHRRRRRAAPGRPGPRRSASCIDRLGSPPAGRLSRPSAAGARARRASRRRLPRARASPLGRAWSLLDPILTAIRDASPEVERIVATGSFRRFAAVTGDLEVLGGVGRSDKDERAAAGAAVHLLGPARGPRQGRGPVRSGGADDPHRPARHVRATPGVAHRLCGSRLAGAAARRQPGTDPHPGRADRSPRAARARSRPRTTCTRRSTWRPCRRNCAKARARSRPPPGASCHGCSCHEQIRGDLHMHTDWSDGRDPLEAMLLAAEALGYEYVAITDHSQTSAIARGLDVDRLERQMDAVAAAREAHPGDRHPARIRGRHPAGRLARLPGCSARTARRGARLAARCGRTFRRAAHGPLHAGDAATRSSRS